jgi:hypothetical protein
VRSGRLKGGHRFSSVENTGGGISAAGCAGL